MLPFYNFIEYHLNSDRTDEELTALCNGNRICGCRAEPFYQSEILDPHYAALAAIPADAGEYKWGMRNSIFTATDTGGNKSHWCLADNTAADSCVPRQHTDVRQLLEIPQSLFLGNLTEIAIAVCADMVGMGVYKIVFSL